MILIKVMALRPVYFEAFYLEEILRFDVRLSRRLSLIKDNSNCAYLQDIFSRSEMQKCFLFFFFSVYNYVLVVKSDGNKKIFIALLSSILTLVNELLVILKSLFKGYVKINCEVSYENTDFRFQWFRVR